MSVPDIKTLQQALYPLLGNIVVKGEGIQEQFNIADTTDENIYKIPEDTPNLDKTKYAEFLQFMFNELTNNNEEFSQNKGEIVTAHYLKDIYKIGEFNRFNPSLIHP